MSLVLDASLTLAWLFDDEGTAGADQILTDVARDGASVPAIWPLEVANALLMATRRGRIERETRDVFLRHLSALRIAVDAETHRQAWPATLELADRHGLTVYDACYLELALRCRLPMASLDRQLRRAAEDAGVVLRNG